MTQNYSLYTIPIYWAIALYPHMYAVSLIRTSISYDTWNMHNPRGQATAPSYQKLLSAATFARFERAEAAHANGMENASFFVGAVLAGCMGGVDAWTMNAASGMYLALKIVYTALYLNTTTQKMAYFRSLTWLTGVILLMGVYVKAGNALLSKV